MKKEPRTLYSRSPFDSKIIVVDDEPSIVRFLLRALQGAGYSAVEGFTDPAQASEYLGSVTPDLVVLDIRMPGMDGYQVLSKLCGQLPQDAFLPVLVVSGIDDVDARRRAVAAGAKDYLQKPIDIQEFLLHVRSLVETRLMNLRMQHARSVLEELVEERTRELNESRLELLDKLGRVAEVRDDATGQHTNRVGHLSALLARELRLPDSTVEAILRAAPLHDLGKVAIADRVLLKKGSFDADERAEMRRHALLGSELLQGSRSAVLRLAADIALSHHERWDGLGYPQGLQGTDIPVCARIVAVADAFDALAHERPYKKAWSITEALAEMQRESGWQFDPAIVDALMRVVMNGRESIGQEAEVATA